MLYWRGNLPSSPKKPNTSSILARHACGVHKSAASSCWNTSRTPSRDTPEFLESAPNSASRCTYAANRVNVRASSPGTRLPEKRIFSACGEVAFAASRAASASAYPSHTEAEKGAVSFLRATPSSVAMERRRSNRAHPPVFAAKCTIAAAQALSVNLVAIFSAANLPASSAEEAFIGLFLPPAKSEREVVADSPVTCPSAARASAP